MTRIKQRELFPPPKKSRRGGKREGAGRKRASRPRVAHTARESVCLLDPLHVTIRVCEGIPSLRNLEVEKILRTVFCAMKSRAGFKIVEYSIQTNHLHLIIEAESKDALTRGMISLKTRIARRVNKYFGRVGKFFSDRYHVVVMRKVNQVRRTLLYVLANAKKHGVYLASAIDRFSSGHWYRHWLEEPEAPPGIAELECPTQPLECMLLHQGAHQLGRLSIHDIPGQSRWNL